MVNTHNYTILNFNSFFFNWDYSILGLFWGNPILCFGINMGKFSLVFGIMRKFCSILGNNMG